MRQVSLTAPPASNRPDGRVADQVRYLRGIRVFDRVAEGHDLLVHRLPLFVGDAVLTDHQDLTVVRRKSFPLGRQWVRSRPQAPCAVALDWSSHVVVLLACRSAISRDRLPALGTLGAPPGWGRP